MRRMTVIVVLAGAVAAVWPASAQRFVPAADPDYPRIRYADSLLSLNERCAVAGQKLNVKVRPVYVNGQPVGFC